MNLLEAVIYEPASGGYIPHIKWNSNLIKLMGGNQIKGLNTKLRSTFPELINKLKEAGITSNGREMYAKGIIARTFESKEEANHALAIYKSIINGIK
jgi:hypothetical protein